jgi:FHS family glucose/mannose:H+ symporter-like MFS transporter
MNSSPPRDKSVFTTDGTVLLHLDFLVTGIVMTFLGPMLPILAARWSITDAQSGALIFVEFFSAMFGMLLSSILVQRLGYRITLIVGLGLMASGVTLLASGPYLLGVVSVAILGFGYGITTPAGNLRTAELDPARSASALNVINAVWGIGAMSSPFLLAIAQKQRHPTWFLYGTALALLLLLFVFQLARFVPDTRAHVADAPRPSHGLWTSRTLAVICVLFFVYVGTETSFGAWTATYAHRLAPSEKTFWAVVPSFYWGALLIGRAAAPVALRFKPATSVAMGGLTIAMLGGTALVSARGIVGVMFGSILAGLGLASIFPISVSLLTRWFGDSARRSSGPVFSSGNLGGAVVPWLVGVLSTHAGNLRLAFFVPLLGIVAMLVFYVISDASQATNPSLRVKQNGIAL